MWAGVRLQSQPFVIAGDVILTVQEDGVGQVVVISRLYDVGRSALQLSAERLTLLSNAHAVKVAQCATAGLTQCVAESMSAGFVVLPPSFAQVGAAGAVASSLNVPATASKWAVHWAVNPELSIYTAYFQFCRGVSQFQYEVHSSWGGPGCGPCIRCGRSIWNCRDNRVKLR